ncbi:hypothetical protein OH77DRAFT_1501733, partial [Trametes cingulata]
MEAELDGIDALHASEILNDAQRATGSGHLELDDSVVPEILRGQMQDTGAELGPDNLSAAPDSSRGDPRPSSPSSQPHALPDIPDDSSRASTDLPAESEELFIDVKREDVRIALEYIRLLRHARLDDSGLDQELLEQLRNPPEVELTIDDPDVVLSIELYLGVGNASIETYNAVRDALARHPAGVQVLSYYKVQRTIEKITGIYSQRHDMCINSCVGYTGPRANLDKCPSCGEARYCPIQGEAGQKVARQHFTSILPGAQLQALCRTPESAKRMMYFYETATAILARTPAGQPVSEYFDFPAGSLALEAVADGTIGPHDILLVFSIDGAQLYQNKESDCWIGLWLVPNLDPELRYKKPYVLPALVIPGPKHPEDLDSFMFPSFYHVSALMRE